VGVVRVSGTLALISFLGYSSQLLVVIPTKELDSSLLKLLLPFNILLALLYYNYYLTIHTDPGAVPKGWVRPPPAWIAPARGGQGSVLSTLTTNPLSSPSWPPQEPDMNKNTGFEVKRLTGGPRHCRTCKGEFGWPCERRAVAVASLEDCDRGRRRRDQFGLEGGPRPKRKLTSRAVKLQLSNLHVRTTAANASVVCSGWTTTVRLLPSPAPRATDPLRDPDRPLLARRPVGRQLVRAYATPSQT